MRVFPGALRKGGRYDRLFHDIASVSAVLSQYSDYEYFDHIHGCIYR
jgi:hypothetical protein